MPAIVGAQPPTDPDEGEEKKQQRQKEWRECSHQFDPSFSNHQKWRPPRSPSRPTSPASGTETSTNLSGLHSHQEYKDITEAGMLTDKEESIIKLHPQSRSGSSIHGHGTPQMHVGILKFKTCMSKPTSISVHAH